MAKFLIKVNSITISVPPHAGSETGAVVSTSKINSSTSCKINGNSFIVDGDEGTWICPICNSIQKFSVHGNSKIKINGKSACQTGVTFNVGHGASIIKEDLEYDDTININ